MLLVSLLLIPLIGIFIISTAISYDMSELNIRRVKYTALFTSILYLLVSLIIYILFVFIGLYGSSNKVRSSFYLFLYTLFGSLFLLLSIITMSSIMGTTDFDALYKVNFNYYTQLFLFYVIFIAFAVITYTIFLNT